MGLLDDSGTARAVYRVLPAGLGWLTASEIAEKTGLRPQTVRRQLVALRAEGLAERSPHRQLDVNWRRTAKPTVGYGTVRDRVLAVFRERPAEHLTTREVADLAGLDNRSNAVGNAVRRLNAAAEVSCVSDGKPRRYVYRAPVDGEART